MNTQRHVSKPSELDRPSGRPKRDLTKDQFEYRATKLGFKKGGFMGYWSLASDPNTNVSVWNAGKRRRDQLRYLIAQDNRAAARLSPDGKKTNANERKQ